MTLVHLIFSNALPILMMVLCFGAVQGFNELGSPYFMRSPRGLLMGDAYLATEVHPHALFYNPALMGRHRGVHLFPINLAVGSTDVRKDFELFEDLPKEPQGVSGRLMGYPVHVDVATTPGFQAYHMALQYFYHVQFNSLLSNNTHPVLDVDYRYDNGFIVGGGWPVYQQGCSTFSLGASAKYIKREGLRDRFPLVGTTVLDLINNEDLEAKEILRTLGTHTDKTWGFDVGMDYQCKQGVGFWGMGLSFMDVMTTFKVPEGKTLPPQPMTVNWGTAAGLDFGPIDFTLALDLTPINLESEPADLIRVGAKIGTPFISLLAGKAPAGFSYGVVIDIFFLELTAGFYRERMGGGEEAVRKRRGIIYLSFLDFSFDGP